MLDWLAENGAGYVISAKEVRRPDGVSVAIDRDDPMGTLGHLVQEDLCLLEKRGDPLHVAGCLSLDTWQGRERVQFRVVDAADPRQSRM